MIAAPRPVVMPRAVARGFTLLEVLVVIIIIGVVISFAALSLNPGNNDLEDEARRLQALIALVSQEAVLQNEELAVEFTSDGYQFLSLQGSKWVVIKADDTFRPRTLPEDLVVEYQAEGDKLTLGSQDGEDATPPRIFFLSSGEVSPFRLIFHRRGEADEYVLTGDVRGKTKLLGPDDAG